MAVFAEVLIMVVVGLKATHLLFEYVARFLEEWRVATQMG
jgi:hypothetical protein